MIVARDGLAPDTGHGLDSPVGSQFKKSDNLLYFQRLQVVRHVKHLSSLGFKTMETS
jgi:hypothetical protein